MDNFEEHSRRLRKRYRADRRYRLYGKAAIAFALLFLLVFFASVVSRALPAFSQYEVRLALPTSVTSEYTQSPLSEKNARGILDKALLEALGGNFGGNQTRGAARARRGLLSPLASFDLIRQMEQEAERAQPSSSRQKNLDKNFDMSFALSSASERFLRVQAKGEEGFAELSEFQRAALRHLQDQGRIKKRFNVAFFTHSDSRVPSAAGIRGALLGSFWALLIAFLLAFPLGLLSAVHLQEFAPRNRLTAIIELAIYNLAAVPSIVFGLLGLAIFLNWWGLPRSAPLTGGMVLALMTLPTIVVAARSALAAVPDGIRNAGLALGASRSQTVFHHVLPQAMPGILTGTIIGMAQALGETAPLLMIGMVAFVSSAPVSPVDPATALPVQIFLWADHPDPAFSSRAAAAILVMLVFLVAMNAAAVVLRRAFERKRHA